MFIALVILQVRRSVGAGCAKTNMSLLSERATQHDMLVYKHAAPPEQGQVSQIYDYRLKRLTMLLVSASFR
jgi:hypothetical protein